MGNEGDGAAFHVSAGLGEDERDDSWEAMRDVLLGLFNR
jgi:hypothetical protein